MDTRTPERKAKDDAIRTRVEAEGTTFSRLPKEKQAQLVAAARRKKQQRGTNGESKMKHETHEIMRRVGYDGYYCLIVPDHAAGRRGRFTVYVIPSSPSRRVRIIGRELTIGHARRVANASLPKKTRRRSRGYGPCDDCGVVGCNIHQIMGWASPPD